MSIRNLETSTTTEPVPSDGNLKGPNEIQASRVAAKLLDNLLSVDEVAATTLAWFLRPGLQQQPSFLTWIGGCIFKNVREPWFSSADVLTGSAELFKQLFQQPDTVTCPVALLALMEAAAAASQHHAVELAAEGVAAAAAACLARPDPILTAQEGSKSAAAPATKNSPIVSTAGHEPKQLVTVNQWRQAKAASHHCKAVLLSCLRCGQDGLSSSIQLLKDAKGKATSVVEIAACAIGHHYDRLDAKVHHGSCMFSSFLGSSVHCELC